MSHYQASRTVELHPARMIFHAVGQHSSLPLESFAKGFRISIFERLNHHEEHGAF